MAQPAKGIIIKFGGAAGDAVGELRSLSGPSGSADTIDTSHHGMASKARTFMGTLVDNGTVSFEAAMSPANIEMVEDEFEEAATISIQVTFPFATPVTALFNAILVNRELSTSGEVDGELLMSGELQISGDITWGGLS